MALSTAELASWLADSRAEEREAAAEPVAVASWELRLAAREEAPALMDSRAEETWPPRDDSAAEREERPDWRALEAPAMTEEA